MTSSRVIRDVVGFPRVSLGWSVWRCTLEPPGHLGAAAERTASAIERRCDADEYFVDEVSDYDGTKATLDNFEIGRFLQCS